MSLQSRISALITAVGADIKAIQTDARWTNARTPTAHHTTHEAGGSDPIIADGMPSTASLRTLGTGQFQAVPGNMHSPSLLYRNGAAYPLSLGANRVALDTWGQNNAAVATYNSNGLNITAAGMHLFIGSVYVQNATGVPMDMSIGLEIGAGGYSAASRNPAVANGGWALLNFAQVLSVTAGQFMGLYVYVNPATIPYGANLQPGVYSTFLQVVRLG